MRRLEVRLDRGVERVPVGTLVEQGRRILFEYDAGFLADPLPISPFRLPVRPGVFEDGERTFGGLFGVFNDSLPDGWGLLLMDRVFRRRGVDPARITPLDRLAYIGSRAVGALTYHPPADLEAEAPLGIDLARLARQAERILAGSQEEVLPELRIAGGSPGGARPKALVGVRTTDDHFIAGIQELPEGYRHYLVKFGAPEDGPDIGVVELAYAAMAGAAGIDMPATRIFETADGSRYFGAERFDRDGSRRFHVHTLGGLLHASHRIPSVDYIGFLRATFVLTEDYRQLRQAFRRMVFNVLAHNRDDHVKNVSFLMRPDGAWELSPAYDLVFSSGINGWHTMDVAGEAENPSYADMLAVADACDLEGEDALDVIRDVRRATARWREFAHRSGVPDLRAEIIETVIASHLADLPPDG